MVYRACELLITLEIFQLSGKCPKHMILLKSRVTKTMALRGKFLSRMFCILSYPGDLLFFLDLIIEETSLRGSKRAYFGIDIMTIDKVAHKTTNFVNVTGCA